LQKVPQQDRTVSELNHVIHSIMLDVLFGHRLIEKSVMLLPGFQKGRDIKAS
jgi:hypothetical protein